MKPALSKAKAKAKAKAKPKPKQKAAQPSAPGTSGDPQQPRARQPLVAEGLHTVVRKHSGMGCAIVELSDMHVRQAVLAEAELIYIEGIAIQVKPHFDKDTNAEMVTDLFLAWGHKVEKATPLPADLLVEFFDAKHAELAGGKLPARQALGSTLHRFLQPPSYEAPWQSEGYEAQWPSPDYNYKQWYSSGYSGYSNSMPPLPFRNGAGYNPQPAFHQEQLLQYHAAGELARANPAAAALTPSTATVPHGHHGSISHEPDFHLWGTRHAVSSTSRNFLRSENADTSYPGKHDKGEPEIYMSAAVRALVEREGGGAFCIGSDDEHQLSSASATTEESVHDLEEESYVEPAPRTPTAAAPAVDKVGSADSQEANLRQILSTFPLPPSSSLEAWLAKP